ncbi:hypothetical protein SLS57_000116 [Botryosphaeria dothidea]
MQLTTTSILTALAATIASAAPMSTGTVDTTPFIHTVNGGDINPLLLPRKSSGKHTVTFCLDANRKRCYTDNNIVLGTCYNVAPDYNDRITSIYLNRGLCRLFFDSGCRGQSMWFTPQGINDLAKVEIGRFNNRLSSVQCFQ